MKMKLLVFILLGYLGMSFAGVPNEISYQGRLREYGQPVNGQRTFNFKIYASAEGGVPVWTSGDVSLTVTTGTFSYILQPSGVNWLDKDFWLETVVNGKITSPREKFTATPYALHSRTAEDLSKPTAVLVSSSGINCQFSKIVNISTPTAFDDAATKGYVEQWLPVGTILMWGGPSTNIPTGWLLCDGSAISRTTYARLFTAIGVTHGAGDGSTTFNLPNLTDRFIVGAGAGYSVAATGGEATHTLTISEMPSHSHTVDPPATGTSTNGNHSHSLSSVARGDQDGNSDGSILRTSNRNDGGINASTAGAGDHSHTVDIGAFSSASTGGGAAHENRPPYYALCYIIKY